MVVWSFPSTGASSREDLPRTPKITQTHLGYSSAGALQTFAKPSNVRLVKSFLSQDRSWPYLSMLLISVCTVALGVWARLYHLGFPPRILWDEKYFPAMANKYLQGVYQFDLHPPLGKFIIAIGISLLGNEPLGWRIMPTLLGLAVAVKWAAFPVAVPAGYILWRKGLLRPFLGGLWISALVYVAVVYVGALITITANPIQAWVWAWDWHVDAARKVTAVIPHTWGSPWWSWPIMLRPIRFFYVANAEGLLQVVLAIGNPLIWWSSTLAVLVSIFDIARNAVARELSADDPIIPIVLGYVFLLAPWVAGTRIPYIYNYLPIYPFAILALVYWLCKIWSRLRWGPWAVVAFTACAVALTVFFLPLVLAIPISEDDLMRRVWIDYWFEYEKPVPGSGCLVPNPTRLCPQ